MSGWDGDKNDYLTRQRDGREVAGVRQYNPNPEMCCEACVFGRGSHSGWCKAAPVEVYRNERGSITSDGVLFQAWRQLNRWHVRRVGDVFHSLEAAIEALTLYDDPAAGVTS